MKQLETIAAVATPSGAGGISIIRISGKDAFSLCAPYLKMKTPLLNMESHTVQYGHVVCDGKIIDECMITKFCSPRSYTMEDTVEISSHGGVSASGAILDLLLKGGVRLANPGEFTMRAFLNGRIDLSQAEAVNDIINSKTNKALLVAVNQLGGSLSRAISSVRNELVSICASLAVGTDFPEEDIEELTGIDLVASLNKADEEINSLLKTADEGRVLKSGVRCAIVGRPNAGKSSLLNYLLNENRAIVTEVAGTTRDIIEEYVNIGGVPVCLGDTAGIRETEDKIEAMGVSKTKEYIENADLCLLVLDGASHLSNEDKKILELLKDKNHLIIINKADLEQKLTLDKDAIFISAKTGEGIESLKKAISDLFIKENITGDKPIITSLRQKEALLRAHEALLRAKKTLLEGFPEDMAYIDLESAVSALGEIVGQSVSEEIVHEIFGKFCLGK